MRPRPVGGFRATRARDAASRSTASTSPRSCASKGRRAATHHGSEHERIVAWAGEQLEADLDRLGGEWFPSVSRE
jgi:hypothetical protein